MLGRAPRDHRLHAAAPQVAAVLVVADLAAVRDQFNETKWVRWNVVRAVASTAAFGSLAWALVLHGRTTRGVHKRGPSG
jgi:uncharacterized membrane protein